jgi:hypothetical protein
MISIKVDIEAIDDLNTVLSCLDQIKDLIQSSYSAENFSSEFEISSKESRLKLDLLSDRRENFNGIQINSCCD